MHFTLKRLSHIHKKQVLNHFLRLDKESRASRFFSSTSNENMQNYVEKIDFNNGIFGIFNENLDIIGLGECVFFKEKEKMTAEVAFTVEKQYQGNGLGNKLMKRVVQYANSKDVHELQMYCIRTNQAILHLAKKYKLVPQYDGTEISGVVKTPNILPLFSSINEQFEDNVATFELAISFQNKIIKQQMEKFEENQKTFQKFFSHKL